jgi:copper homeostasis protein
MPAPERLLEVAVESLEAAEAAERGGAHRVELMSGAIEGGLTPSAGFIAIVRQRVRIPVHVMIRPRGGDFCYSHDELLVMNRDIETAKQLGADGILVGTLSVDGEVPVDGVKYFVELARPMAVTFHRAFDMSRDLQRSLERLIEAGVDAVLTAGGEQSAAPGVLNIARLVLAAQGRIQVMAGGSIRRDNVRHIIEKTGVRAIHAGLRSTAPSPMRFRNERIAFGPLRDREYQRSVVLEEDVRHMLAQMNGEA